METDRVELDEPETRQGEAARGCLWIVATPIGTIGDLSSRAASTLAAADLVLAEDTRHLGKLIGAAGIPISGRTLSFHEHNEDQRLPELLAALAEGKSLVLTSDAGTPVLSDPGYILVREARRRRLEVRSVPGPSAFTAALAASGQPPLPAVLAGFLPPRSAARRQRLESLQAFPWTMVFFLSPHRLGRELGEAASILGPRRPATLLAEISKLHERALMGTLEELAASGETEHPRGEYVLVVGPRGTGTTVQEDRQGEDPELTLAVYREAVRRGYGRAQALRWTAARLGLSRKRVFELLENAADRD
ncbi:MAG: 16S rRNA (cytidine(1402)-2'-O)-methyltransferase [Acidobacteria bacterium]|nr:16S rRNA (cytidine(1402)-2'-O)-methyltransferase [Acidobacteriota bacterium]